MNASSSFSCAPGLRRLAAAVALVLAAAFATACSEEEAVYIERPVEEIYNTALDALDAGNYEVAVQEFEEVDRQHPYSVWATKAQLMSAYVYYLNDSYDEAIIALERFIDLHPGNADIPYAYYLRGISYYEQIVDVGRDQRITQLALETLRETARRFPDSVYARDASLKIDLALDHLAGKEMEIGRFYQRRNEHLAAINRFRTVVEQFQTTTHVPEALHRIVESYYALGITQEAQAAAAVLGYNYPGSEWYADSYALVQGEERPEGEKGWFDSLWSSVF